MSTVRKPLSADGKPLEIERKYLIEYPDIGLLENYPGVVKAEITQVYFNTENEQKLRVRSWKTADRTVYYLTRKKKISDMVRVEEESEITERDFLAMPGKGIGEKRSISKTRYCLPYHQRTVEVDIYPFWDNRATAEVELEREDEEVVLPDMLKVIREVTKEKEYTNYNLAAGRPEK